MKLLRAKFQGALSRRAKDDFKLVSQGEGHMSWVFQESDPMGGAAGEAYANTLKSPAMQHVLAREAIQNSVDAGIEGENSRRLDGAYSWCGNASSLDRKRGSVDSTSLPRLFARRVKVARRNGARSALALWQQHHGVTSSTLGK